MGDALYREGVRRFGTMSMMFDASFAMDRIASKWVSSSRRLVSAGEPPEAARPVG